MQIPDADSKLDKVAALAPFGIRRKRIAIALGIVLLSIALGVGAVAMGMGAEPGQGGGLACLGCFIAFVLFLAGLLYGNYAARLVRPACITDQYVYLVGVNPGFLARLPDWPYPGRI